MKRNASAVSQAALLFSALYRPLSDGFLAQELRQVAEVFAHSSASDALMRAVAIQPVAPAEVQAWLRRNPLTQSKSPLAQARQRAALRRLEPAWGDFRKKLLNQCLQHSAQSCSCTPKTPRHWG